MSHRLTVDVCVIGAGSGGLTLAAVASRLGAKVALVEKGEMGGDCLNTGCVPSKALIAAAGHARSVRDASRFGIRAAAPETDWAAVHRHVREVQAAIAPNDSQERFESLGVRVIRAAGRFEDERTVCAGDVRIHARFFVLATGSSPFVPPIPGLADVPYFTNENLFGHVDPVGRLLVIGGGPIGLEMAQAHRRLGAEVVVLEAGRMLPRDDAELAAVVVERLRGEGIALHEGAEVMRVERCDAGGGSGVRIHARIAGQERRLDGTHLLVATGRRANVDGLNLDAAGVRHGPRGVEVDARLRTTNRRVFAIGDVAGPYPFTHMAAYQAGIVIRNMLFRMPARVDYSAVPWVIYTDPELAHVGMSEADAGRAGRPVRILRWSFADNDRAQAERRTEGRIKVVVGRRGRVLGASIAGLHAGELIQPWILAVSRRMKIGDMAAMIAPYPTLGEANKRVAGTFYEEALFSSRMRWLVRWLLRF